MRVPIAPILAVALVLALAVPTALASSLTVFQGVSPSPAGVRALADSVVVTVNGAGATPQVLTVDAGAIIQWWNRDDIPHTITADDGSFGPLQVNDGDRSAAISLPPGVHDYHINSVSSVTGTIVVRDNTQSPTPTLTASPIVTPTLTASPIVTPTLTASPIVTPTLTASPIVTSIPAPPASPTAPGASSPTVIASPSATGTSPSGSTPSPTGAAAPSATDVGAPPTMTVRRRHDRPRCRHRDGGNGRAVDQPGDIFRRRDTIRRLCRRPYRTANIGTSSICARRQISLLCPGDKSIRIGDRTIYRCHAYGHNH